MPSHCDSLTELVAAIESAIADKEARLLTVIGDVARTLLIEDIAELHVRRNDLVAAFLGEPGTRAAQ